MQTKVSAGQLRKVVVYSGDNLISSSTQKRVIKHKKVVLTFLKIKTVSPNSMADEVCFDKFELGLNYSMLLYSFSN